MGDEVVASEKAHIASTSTSRVISRLRNLLSIFRRSLRRKFASRFIILAKYGGGLVLDDSFLCNNLDRTRIFAANSNDSPVLRSFDKTIGQLRRTASWEAKAKRS